MDFVTALEREYRKRVLSNKRYSLRAFARDLKIDQSSLSKVLARKRNPTNGLIMRMSANLGYSTAKTKKFLDVAKMSISHPNYSEVELEKFVAISDWYHDAILELIDTEVFQPNTKWIAQALGLKESQVKSAVRKMQSLDLLEITPENRWIDKSKVNTIHPDKISVGALKEYQKQVLQNSLQAIDKVNLLRRSHTSNTFSASVENIEGAKRLIAKCRKDVAALMRSSDGPKTEVFQFQISLFPLTANDEV